MKKVVWLCHFTNNEIQELLKVKRKQHEFASWIPNLAKGFEYSNDIELHIVTPHYNLSYKKSFQLRNIWYHIIPVGIPFVGRQWPWFFRIDILTNFIFFKHSFKRILDLIKPDIINLIGTENAYYSSAIFSVKRKYPIIIGIQGFITQFKDLDKKTIEIKTRIKIEERILKEFNAFYGEADSKEYIKNFNKSFQFFKLYFPVNEDLLIENISQEKKYDCIYFGRLVVVKGAEEFIKVINELKKTIPSIKGCMIGGGDINYFKNIAKEFDCIDNIDFIGFVKNQNELFNYVKMSKVFLAPPFKERLSSTIREAMYLKTPVVAYATGGIPYINETDENIYLVKTGDYKAMAERTINLLKNEVERKNLVIKAYNFASIEFSLSQNVLRLIESYNNVIKRFKNDL